MSFLKKAVTYDESLSVLYQNLQKPVDVIIPLRKTTKQNRRSISSHQKFGSR